MGLGKLPVRFDATGFASDTWGMATTTDAPLVHRPDSPESPDTVDAGHFQIEAEVLSWGRDHEDDTPTKTLSSSANVKIGLRRCKNDCARER